MSRKKQVLAFKRACDALVGAGVSNPNSQDGIDFCTKRCPYISGCIVLDGNLRRTKRASGSGQVLQLTKEGYSAREVASKLGVGIATVYRYKRGG